MAEIFIRGVNFDRVAEMYGRLPEQLEEPIQQGLDRIAEEILRFAKRRNFGFTDRTGNLRRSLTTNITAPRLSAVVGSKGVDYAQYVEFDHGGRYSYLRRARDDFGERRMQQVMDVTIQRWLNRNGFN